MKISLKWLTSFVHLDESPEQIAEILTATGLEVEGFEEVEQIKGGMKGLVIGEVIQCEKHPNADTLSLTLVDIGEEEPLSIVCGAPNVAKGQKVVVATIGTTLYPSSGEPFQIKKGKIRGEVSMGMICAEDEIGIGSSHDGIIVLETSLPNGSAAASYFKLESDIVFEIGLTPNRADAASHLGVARDLSAFLKRPVCLPEADSTHLVGDNTPIKVQVLDTEGCKRYVGVCLKNITVGPSPEWLQAALRSIDLEPINNVVDCTNYILHGLGQPMHAFDAKKIKGKEVHVQCLPAGTPFKGLDGVERKLLSSDLMICDADNTPMCMAGVFGGDFSGISENTTEVFLESAYFSPVYTRKSSSHHALFTDAAYRFSRGTDPNMPLFALKVAISLLSEVAGAEVEGDIQDIYPSKIEDHVFTFSYQKLIDLIGHPIPKQDCIDILESLDISITEVDTDLLEARVPAFRVEVKKLADIAEEVLRIFGINNIPLSEHMRADFLANFPAKDSHALKMSFSERMVSQGYFEIMSNSLTSSKYNQILQDEGSVVQILHPLSEELNVMRTRMCLSALPVLSHNLNRQQDFLRFFEFGYTYHKIESGYVEKATLAMYLSGKNSPEHWDTKIRPLTYFDISGIVTTALDWIQVEVQQRPIENDPLFSFGIEYTVQRGKTPSVLVRFGKISKAICKAAHIQEDIWYAEFDWNLYESLSGQRSLYKELPKFPSVRRDLSLVLPKSVRFQEVEQLARKTEKKLLTDIVLFDVYEGERIDADKKAYAMAFHLLNREKTLDEGSIEQSMQKLMQAFEKDLGAVIRK